jgi:signal transduction histidine kinase
LSARYAGDRGSGFGVHPFSLLLQGRRIAGGGPCAGASKASIRLDADYGSLRFEVEDDGAGFETARIGYGTGLQGMADRLDAIGGTLEVRSQPGEGTTIKGSIPTPAAPPIA